jgi:hypothetical protein
MFTLYDQYFTGGTFSAYTAGSKVNLEFSELMTSTGGSCGFRGDCTYLLKISAKILRDITPDSLKNNTYQVGGLAVLDRLDGLMLVFEHELIHLVIQVAQISDGGASHGTLFKQMVLNIFGQTNIHHGLIARPSGIGRPVVANPVQGQLRAGDTVYVNIKGETIMAVVIKVNPKTVDVHSAKGDFRVGYGALRQAP